MYTISKEFHFSAAHQLHGLEDGHPCRRLHGHNYVVRLFIRGATLNDVGFVVDYRAMDEFKNYIDNELDHHNLNDKVNFATTAENLAAHFFRVASTIFTAADDAYIVYAVEVQETPKTIARYEQAGH
jgi:6-pyruvoyltetrahydropterin/6-carboxytetrahydropterin synthase